jgi:undecaprenyl-diphosphatase
MAPPELAGATLSGAPAPRLHAAALLSCVLVLVLLALQVVLHGPVLALDQAISLYFAQHRDPAITEAMRLVSSLHQTWKVLLATAGIAAALAWRRQWPSVRALIGVPAGMLLNVALKNTFQRPRPRWDDPLVQIATYRFPSGHAVASTVFYGMLCAIVFAHTRSRRWRALAVALAAAMIVLVCFSRVYLGAHYPSDVVAGAAEGLACVLVCVRLLLR